MMKRELITAPLTEPVTVEEVKEHTVIEHSADEALLTRLIKVATEFAERYQNRMLVSQTWRYYFDDFPSCIEIEASPVQSLTVKYLDENSAPQTLAASNYRTDLKHFPIYIEPVDAWPDTDESFNNVWVDVVVGYTDVPETTRHAIMLLVAELYNNRESTSAGVVLNELPFGLYAMLNAEKL